MSSLREDLTYEPVELNFGTSGLRGLVIDMTDLECFINTRGFLQFLAAEESLTPGSTIYLAGDLRDSTPRILAAVMAAVVASGHKVSYLGLIPTPALALRSISRRAPGIMVTGSHIPADRNGIKFYKAAGEVLKEDEASIKAAVAAIRAEVYGQAASENGFDAKGMLTHPPTLPAIDETAATEYLERYTKIFGPDTFKGKKVVYYQHSAVGRDLLVNLFSSLGAEVVPVGRSDVFIPIDSENVTPKDNAYFRSLVEEHPGAFAVLSTDGDSDRPFVIDEIGKFHRGDVLGAVVAQALQADAAVYTVTTSDAVDSYMTAHNVSIANGHTKIGSPYVVRGMYAAIEEGYTRVVGWEVNGGFLTGSNFEVNGTVLTALATRDAALPMIMALVAAVSSGRKVSEVFADLPQRFTGFGQIDKFPVETAKAIVERFRQDTPEVRAELMKYFSAEHGFDEIVQMNAVDGIRIYFKNGDIAHLRQSGNAPQFRMYTIADSQERADAIVALAIAEPDGIYRRLEKLVIS